MGEAIDILLLLSVLIVGLEAGLFLCRDTLLRTRQAAALEIRVGKVKDEVTRAREQVEARRAERTTAQADLQTAQAALQQAEHDLAEKRRPREVLLHVIAEGGAGATFQARLGKMLPVSSEANQTLLWSYENVIELQARDPATAQKIATRIFAAKAGYTVGPFRQVDATQDAAA